jgi:hypothetical protein
MTYAVLAAIALVQIGFIVILIFFIFTVRIRFNRRARAIASAQERLQPVLRQWLVGVSEAKDVRDVLASLAPSVARDVAIRFSQAALPDAKSKALAGLVRYDEWYRDAMADSRSIFWWRRLESARLIAELGTRADEGVVRSLLMDKHAAVRVGASAALRKVSSPKLIELVLDELPDQPLVVRSYQMLLLRDQWRIARDILLPRLTAEAPVLALPHWLNVAEALALPELLDAATKLAGHTSPNVRLAVARALRGYFNPTTPKVLITLLSDTDWRVRAQAARSLGVLGDPAVVAALAESLTDRIWWVRFRSALSLCQLGEPGRRVLRATRDGTDPYASQMASMVSGLSPGSVLELTEA